MYLHTEDIDLILEKSKIAQKQWLSKSKPERIQIIQNMKKVFEDNQEELADSINEEGGFSKEDCLDEVYDVFDGIDYYSKKYSEKENINFPLDEEFFPESNSEIKFYPLGVISMIGTWNFPLWQTMITVIPALLTGNSVIYKPSEKMIKTGLLINKVINLTKGLPENASASQKNMVKRIESAGLTPKQFLNTLKKEN